MKIHDSILLQFLVRLLQSSGLERLSPSVLTRASNTTFRGRQNVSIVRFVTILTSFSQINRNSETSLLQLQAIRRPDYVKIITLYVQKGKEKRLVIVAKILTLILYQMSKPTYFPFFPKKTVEVLQKPGCHTAAWSMDVFTCCNRRSPCRTSCPANLRAPSSSAAGRDDTWDRRSRCTGCP